MEAPGFERLAFERLCAEAAPLGADTDPRTIEAAYAAYADRLDQGGDALNGCISEAIRAATGGEGSPNVLAARYRHIARDAAAETSKPLPGAQRALRELQKLSIPLAILANGVRSAEQQKAASIGFTGRVIVSEDIGAQKPDLRAFSMLAREMALPAECIWYVGSDYDRDIAPARVAGFNAVWLRRTKATAASGDSVHVIEKVDDVLELIKEPYTRSLLGLRHIMRTALDWRPGRFLDGKE